MLLATHGLMINNCKSQPTPLWKRTNLHFKQRAVLEFNSQIRHLACNSRKTIRKERHVTLKTSIFCRDGPFQLLSIIFTHLQVLHKRFSNCVTEPINSAGKSSQRSRRKAVFLIYFYRTGSLSVATTIVVVFRFKPFCTGFIVLYHLWYFLMIWLHNGMCHWGYIHHS